MMACLDIISTFFTSFLLLFCICLSLSVSLLEDRVPFAEITKEHQAQASDFCSLNKQLKISLFHHSHMILSYNKTDEKVLKGCACSEQD